MPIVVDGQIRGRSWYFRDITESVKAEKLQSCLFRIAQLSRESVSLDAFYAEVHAIVGELMNAKNFYIAEYDEETHRLYFPYFVDEYDQRVEWLNPGHGLTAYVLRTGQPILATPEEFDQLVRAGDVRHVRHTGGGRLGPEGLEPALQFLMVVERLGVRGLGQGHRPRHLVQPA